MWSHNNKYTQQNWKYQIRAPDEKYRIEHACKYKHASIKIVLLVWEEGVYETGVVQYTDIGKEAEINEKNTKIGTNTQILKKGADLN